MKKEKSELDKLKVENKKLKQIIIMLSDMNSSLAKVMNNQVYRLEMLQNKLGKISGSSK